MSRALASPDLISLAAGFVDQHTLPAEPTKMAMDAIFSDAARARAALQYGTTHGYPPLREALLARQLAADGQTAAEANIKLEQVVLTAGSNQLLHLVGESLCNPGDIILCSAPTYLVFLGTLGNIGARSIGIATDEYGMIPAALEEELDRLDATDELSLVKAIYQVSYFDNPSGLTLQRERRGELVEIARRWSRDTKIHVIDDAAYRELRYAGDDLPSIRAFDPEGDTVIVAGTFSKTFSPGIRVGWGILPPHLVDPVCNQKGNIDFGSPNFSQHLLAKVLELGLYDPHIDLLRASYAKKMQAMLAAAEKYLRPLPNVHWHAPDGGLYVWLSVPPEIETGPSGTLFDVALEEGMLYVPGQYCYPHEGEPVRKNTIRLSFGVQTVEKIDQGMAALARAIHRVLEHHAAR